MMSELLKILLGWFALSIVTAPIMGRVLRRASEAQTRPLTRDETALTAAGQFNSCARSDCVPESDGTTTGHRHVELETR